MIALARQAIGFAVLALVSVGSVVAQAADVPKADLVNRKVLRVCADPANLPFSNQKLEGFENKIAAIVADELKVPVEYSWFPQATGFIRQTLFAKRCDVVIGWGQGDELVLNTNAVYRSIYAMIYKKGVGLDGVDSLFDPKLKDKKIGVVAGLPPSDIVAKAGLMAKAKPYQMMVDRRFFDPAQEMVDDIASGAIDVGLQWGPIAGFYAAKANPKLVVVPLLKDTTDSNNARMIYRVTMGVRQSDDAWKRQLNTIIKKRQADIDKVLLEYGVPLLEEDNSIITKPRQ